MAKRLHIVHRASGKTLREYARATTLQAVAGGHSYTFEPREFEGRQLLYITNEHLLPGFYLPTAGYGDSGGPYWLRNDEFEVRITLPAPQPTSPTTLREARLAQNIGMREFAMRIGILPSIYCNIENGKDPPSTIQAEAIATALGLTELPYIPPHVKDEGPIIPLHIRRADGQTATPADYQQMYEFLNDPDSPRNSGN